MNPGLTETTVDATSRVLTTLPGQFLALVLMNTCFILGLLWFLNGVDQRRMTGEQSAVEAREKMMTPLIAACFHEAKKGD